MADIQHSALTGTDAVHPFFLPSGTDPGAIGAYKGWFDPAAEELWVRNAANTGWLGPWSIGASTAITAHLADPADAHDASAISIADAATQYTATDVEGALAEVLDGLQAHEADATDAHDASAISIADAGTYYTGTNVEAALQEIGAGGIGGGATDLDDLTDVDVTTVAPTDGQGLVYDTADSLWKPADVASGPALSGYTVTNETEDRSYDANATTIDEVADVLGTLINDLSAGGGGGGGSGHRTLVTLGSDVVNSTTSLANVTGLSFTVPAGQSRMFEAQIVYHVNNTTTGTHWAVDAGDYSQFGMSAQWPITTTSATFQNHTSSNGGSATTSSAATADNIAKMWGRVEANTELTLIVRFAAESGGTVTAKAGSTLEWW